MNDSSKSSDEVNIYNNKNFLDSKTYIPIGFLGTLALLIFFGADLRSSNEVNKTAIHKLNVKIDSEISLLRAESTKLKEAHEDRMEKIEKESQFLRERMIIRMNELTRLVYKIDGMLEGSQNTKPKK